MKILRKSIEIKDVTDKGVVIAAFATLNVWDKDRDMTLSGFFGEQDVTMLPAHDWSHVPIGKGTIKESGDKAVAELVMNLDIPSAKEWHSALLFDLKNGKPLQQWSYGFTILPGGSSDGEVDGKSGRLLRPLPEGGPGCLVHEVSPVLVAAGEMTGTLSVKGLKFSDEIQVVLDAAGKLVERGRSLADLRAKEGRAISGVNQERMGELAAALKVAAAGVESLAVNPQSGPKSAPELRRLYIEHLKRTSGIRE